MNDFSETFVFQTVLSWSEHFHFRSIDGKFSDLFVFPETYIVSQT